MLKRIQAKRKRKIISLVTIAAMIILAVVVLYYVVKLAGFWNAIHTNNTDTQSVTKNEAPKKKTSFNILLLGYAGAQREGGYLTDTMILAHIDIADSSIVLISIPRDLWVPVPAVEGKETFKKINTAYSVGLSNKSYPNKAKKYQGENGGGEMVKDVVSEVTGIPVDYYVAVDFDGFVSIVDSIGGIDVTLEKPLDDQEYPLEGHEDDPCEMSEEELVDIDLRLATESAREVFPCRYEHIYYAAGEVHLNGEEALKVARSRHGAYDGSDFGRADRQQKVILAVKDKVLSLGFLAKLPALLDNLADKIRTDIPTELATKFVKEGKIFSSYQIRNLVLSDKNFLKSDYSDDGQYILVSERNSLVPIQSWAKVLTSIPADRFPSIWIENTTQVEGLGATASERLKALGLDVERVSSASSGASILKVTALELHNSKADQNVLAALEDEFATIFAQPTEERIRSYDIRIRLGEDYAKRTTR